eukprot:TRINITY_DN11127_c0_g1_i1.p1 TRINITY_DN11127_c0_g1~~TRINITY_DN11127_c0_g1_i1.p1  ORF type:complete len:729 (+),score=233.36 TRINITY_DN11127_c0_g1_i1:152-2338(+)
MSQSSPTVCRYFAANGTCFYGDACNFAHIRVNTAEQPRATQQQPPVQILQQERDRQPSPNYAQEQPGAHGPRPRNQITCRNIMQFGYCRYLPHCPYNHDMPEDGHQHKSGDLAGAMHNLNLATGGPAGFPKGFAAAATSGYGYNQQQFAESQHRKESGGAPFVPSYDTPPQILARPIEGGAGPAAARGQARPASRTEPEFASGGGGVFVPSSGIVQPTATSSEPVAPAPAAAPVATHTTRGGTVYFYGDGNPSAPLIQYNNPPRSPASSHHHSHHHHHNHRHPPQSPASPIKPAQAPGRRTVASFFMPDDLRADLQRRNQIVWDTLNADDVRGKEVPPIVHKYHSLQPLDLPARPPTNVAFGYYSSLFKCISTVDGNPIALRRIENFRVSNELALRIGDMWRSVQHPNIVTLADVFISNDIGDVNSLFFAYEFHPGAETLEQRWFAPGSEPISEPVMWTYVSQLLSAIRCVHRMGMAIRCILPSKIVLTAKNRVRLSSAGIVDVLAFDTTKNVQQNQHDDLVSFGKLLLSLACKSMAAVQNLPKSLDLVASRFSAELKNVIVYLLTKPPVGPSALDELTAMIAPRLLFEAEQLHHKVDALESELFKETESGRMFRLLVKLGFINERPEFEMDPSWSETGDRYLLKLFRDYVFHQVYEDGSPVVDFAHVVDCLNKLDVGTSEKILLMSRDEQSILVVSYKDLKRAIEGAFHDLASKKSGMGPSARKRIL